MKKMGLVLFSAVVLMTACSANTNTSKTSSSSSEAKVTLSSNDKKALDKATSEYKTFVEGQIDQLLTDTEKFESLLKEGKLDEAKKIYPLIRMSYQNRLLKVLVSLM